MRKNVTVINASSMNIPLRGNLPKGQLKPRGMLTSRNGLPHSLQLRPDLAESTSTAIRMLKQLESLFSDTQITSPEIASGCRISHCKTTKPGRPDEQEPTTQMATFTNPSRRNSTKYICAQNTRAHAQTHQHLTFFFDCVDR